MQLAVEASNMPTGDFGFLDARGTLAILDNETVSRSVDNSSFGNTWARITHISVTLNGLSHTFPDDLDFLLVSGSGNNLEFWSDAGGRRTLSTATSQ